jgi:hypothetical protein
MATQWFVLLDNQEQVGPISEEDVAQMIHEGRLSGRNVCWRERMQEWTPINRIATFSALCQRESAGGVVDGAKRRIDDLVSSTKKKARITSIKHKIAQHEKRKNQRLMEVGKLFYESNCELLSQEPYEKKVQQARAEDLAMEQLRREIEDLERG